MPEFLSKILQQFSEFWQNLDKSQKNRIYITSAIVIVSIAIGIFMLTRPNRVTLISNASQKEIGEMSSILNESKIWNEVGGNGTSITINAKDNNKAQITLAQKGYPKDGMTFEDAIKMIGISTTESDKKQIWKQQQTSDIAAKIKLLDNIDDASVSLALPEQTIFVTSDQKQSSPSAIIMVKPKNTLTKEQVQGIVMIVSRSVENLDPKQITVVDNNSNILNSEPGDDDVARVTSQEEMRLKKSQELQSKVYDYFNVGQFDNFDTIRVVANPFLDFDKLKSQSKSITNPKGMDNGALISSDISKETLKDGSASGVPGTDTNPGNASAPSYPTGTSGNSNYDKSHEIKNFGYDETMSDAEKATGYLVPEKSSMAISLWYGKRVVDESKLTDAFINQVKTAASTATGIPAANISVSKYKLAAPEVVKKPTADVIKDLFNSYGFFAIMLFLIIGLLIAVAPKRKRTPETELALSQTQSAAAAAAVAGPRFIVPDASNEPVPEIDLEERSEVKKQIEKFVKQKPDAVAQLLRNWLSDEWDT